MSTQTEPASTPSFPASSSALRPFTTLSLDRYLISASHDNRVKLEKQHKEAHADNSTDCADCGFHRWIGYLYKCLYCGLWFCPSCAETHFGKTLSDWIGEKREEVRQACEAKRKPNDKVHAAGACDFPTSNDAIARSRGTACYAFFW